MSSTFPVIVFNSNSTKYSGIGVDYSSSASGFRFWVNGSSADITGTGTAAMYIDTGNFVGATGSFRAPIFYDSDNTSYYVDPASGSVLGGNLYVYTAIGAGDNIRTGIRAYDNTAMAANVGGQLVLGYKYTSAGDYTEGAIIKMYKLNSTSGDYSSGLNFQVRDTGENLATRFWIDPSGNVFNDISIRSPIFYDYNNTGYYLDPTSISTINSSNWVGSLTYTGSAGSQALDTATNDGYASMRVIRNNKSGSDGMYIGYVNSNSGPTRIFGGGSSGGAMIKYATYSEEPGSFRAPIFYDSNDTNYYGDFASTSVINTLRSVGYLTTGKASLSSIYGNFDYTTTNGYLITTNIDYSSFNMPTVIIEGYAYGSSRSINLSIVWYSYAGSFTAQSFTNYGSWDPGVVRIGVNGSGKVCIHLSNNIYYGRMNVRCVYDGGSTTLLGWSIADASYTSLSPVVIVPQASITSSIYIDGSSYVSSIYDINNTAYYLDPASTSRLDQVESNRTYGFTDIRSPIFYDYNNTSYYVDAASVSILDTARIGSGNFGTASALASIGTIGLYRSSGPFISFHEGTTARTAYMQETGGRFYLGEVTYTESEGSFRAPLFYDVNNTAYYVDPANSGSSGAASFNGGITFGIANPYLQSSSYFVIPGGAYFNSGTVYCSAAIQARGGVQNDNGVALTLLGGTGGYTNINGSARSPIFYDSDNTTYYADLSSTGDSIRAAGNIVAYYSDERLKTHLGKIENALEKVDQLEGFYYEANEVAQKLGYKAKREVGVSAQAVQRVLPEIVTDAPVSANYLTIDYERLVPLLIEAIKELKGEVETLKSRLH